mmetsp:Transcript_9682/g.26025  ORF Transcript_9682/g.26025 Transcript_9682/m.26025 type:complete len:81 (-) Transcript_9682:612-854(-)
MTEKIDSRLLEVNEKFTQLRSKLLQEETNVDSMISECRRLLHAESNCSLFLLALSSFLLFNSSSLHLKTSSTRGIDGCGL